MGLVSRVAFFLRKARLKKQLGSYWSDFYVRNGVQPPPDAKNSDGCLEIPQYHLKVYQSDQAGQELLRHPSHLDGLSRAGIRFESKPGKLIAMVDGLRMGLETKGDFGIFLEIFLYRQYCFHREGDLVVIDGGANVGFASLYFANTYRAKVYAFELVSDTAAKATENFEMNPGCAGQISLEPVGLAGSDRYMEVGVNSDDTASNSIYRDNGTDRQSVQLRDVSKVLSEIQAKETGKQIVLKLDVEGAEYEVIERLTETGQLKDISVLMLEWHDQGPERLERIREDLAASGFDWFEQPHGTLYVGQINAIRRASS